MCELEGRQCQLEGRALEQAGTASETTEKPCEAAAQNDERKEAEDRYEKGKKKKYGPGPVMVSDTLCPAVHILGT